MEHIAPIMDRHAPFFLYIYDSQIHCLHSRDVIGKLDFSLSVLSDPPVEVFDRIGRIN